MHAPSIQSGLLFGHHLLIAFQRVPNRILVNVELVGDITISDHLPVSVESPMKRMPFLKFLVGKLPLHWAKSATTGAVHSTIFRLSVGLRYWLAEQCDMVLFLLNQKAYKGLQLLLNYCLTKEPQD